MIDATDKKAIREMLDNAADYLDKLTSWELKFIASITEQFEMRGQLTQKQVDILEQIHIKLP